MSEELSVEQEARQMGWVPAEEFRGDPEKFVSAEDFVDRGKHVMPILKANNKRLEGQVQSLRGETAQLKELLQNSQDAIQALQETYSAATKRAVDKAVADLKAGIKQARADGDVDAELELRDQLDMAQEQARAVVVPENKAPVPKPSENPDLEAFVAGNSWYGKDTRKTLRFNSIAMELRASEEHDGLVGSAFYDKVLSIMDERTNGTPAPRVGAARVSAGGSSKSFASLPSEAREACARQAKRVVGPGRAFKTEAEWQAHYAKLYHEGV